MKSLSIVAADTQYHYLTALAIDRTLQSLPIPAKVLTFSDLPIYSGAEHYTIPTFTSHEDYNTFVLKELGKYVTTDFCLVVQYDGFAVNSTQWTSEYFNFDYIGAPIDKGRIVGNGGFSLRSKKLLDALIDDSIQLIPDRQFGKNEDRVICDYFKDYLETTHQINFAPLELAKKFSFEKGKHECDSFGFHAVWNIVRFCPEDEAYNILSQLKWNNKKALDSTIKVAESKDYQQLLSFLKGINLP